MIKKFEEYSPEDLAYVEISEDEFIDFVEVHEKIFFDQQDIINTINLINKLGFKDVHLLLYVRTKGKLYSHSVIWQLKNDPMDEKHNDFFNQTNIWLITIVFKKKGYIDLYKYKDDWFILYDDIKNKKNNSRIYYLCDEFEFGVENYMKTLLRNKNKK